MQTTELLDLMDVLKLRGMRAAFEETLSEDSNVSSPSTRFSASSSSASSRNGSCARFATSSARPTCRWPRAWIPSSSPPPRSTRP